MEQESFFIQDRSLNAWGEESVHSMKIGGGGTSVCFRVLRHGKWFFEKRLKKEYINDFRYRQAFIKEFEVGIQLEHPNIVRYINLEEGRDSEIVLLIEYVDGEPLGTFVEHHPKYFQNKKNRKRFVNELLSAVEYLHNRQILHLDLKPENILITNQGYHVKLIDLGFSYKDSFFHYNGYTHDFAAPEQILNNPRLTTACDIYALGKIFELYGLLPSSILRRCIKQSYQKRLQTIESLKENIVRERWRKILTLLFAIVFILGLIIFAFTNLDKGTLDDKIKPVDNKDLTFVETKKQICSDSISDGGPIRVQSNSVPVKDIDTEKVKVKRKKKDLSKNIVEDESEMITYMGVTMTKLEKRRGDSIVAYHAEKQRIQDSLRQEQFLVYKEKMSIYFTSLDSFINNLSKDSVTYSTYGKYKDLLRKCYDAREQDSACFNFEKKYKLIRPYNAYIDSIYGYYRKKGEEIINECR